MAYRWLLPRIAFSLPVSYAFVDLGYNVSVVSGASMAPSLNPDADDERGGAGAGSATRWKRDVVLCERWAAHALRIARGDVVAMSSPDEPGTCLVKRVLALEGDWVVATPAAREAMAWRTGGDGAAPKDADDDVLQVPRGHCWVEGDNPTCSVDSATSFGPVPLSLVHARVRYVCWPPWRAGTRVPPMSPSPSATKRLVLQRPANAPPMKPPGWR